MKVNKSYYPFVGYNPPNNIPSPSPILAIELDFPAKQMVALAEYLCLSLDQIGALPSNIKIQLNKCWDKQASEFDFFKVHQVNYAIKDL